MTFKISRLFCALVNAIESHFQRRRNHAIVTRIFFKLNMDTNIWKFLDDSSVKDYTFIVPSVAVGNVGQLSCDLLISSLTMQKIASVYSSAQIPVVGYDPYRVNFNNLSTSCEIYKSDFRKIVVLQFRAPLVYKYANSFLTDLINTFKEKQIKEVIIIAGSYAHQNKNILSSPFRFVASEGNAHIENIKRAKVLEHEMDNDELIVYGGGFAPILYKICVDKLLPSVMLYKFCSEGDNIPDAYDTVRLLAKIIPLFMDDRDLLSQLKQPMSWTLLFGGLPPQEVY